MDTSIHITCPSCRTKMRGEIGSVGLCPKCKARIKVDPLTPAPAITVESKPTAAIESPQQPPSRVFVEAHELDVSTPTQIARLERNLLHTRLLAVAACLLAIVGFWLPKQRPFEMPDTIRVSKLIAGSVRANGYIVENLSQEVVGAWTGIEDDGPQFTMGVGLGAVDIRVSPERGLISANGFVLNDDRGRRRGIIGIHESIAMLSLLPEHDGGPMASVLAGDSEAVLGAWQSPAATEGAVLAAGPGSSHAALVRFGENAWTTPKK